MTHLVRELEVLFAQIPLPVLQFWGRAAYFTGFIFLFTAFAGITLRAGGQWRPGRRIQIWDQHALRGMILTFCLILVTGYIGSFIVLVPGAQTFESLKDLSVFICILLFGYPALIMVPFAYGLSDLAEGVPPSYLLGWLPGYFINPACFWLATLLLGRDPDFRRLKVWLRYGAFVFIFMMTEPFLWGHICSDQFSAQISYRSISPALFFTTGITWILAPFAMLIAYPLSRRFHFYWADLPDHVVEKDFRGTILWQSGESVSEKSAAGIPIRLLIAVPFTTLMVVMVALTSYLISRSAEEDAEKLAGRLHAEIADNINLRLDDYLGREKIPERKLKELGLMLSSLPVAEHGRAIILEKSGTLLAASVPPDDLPLQFAARNLPPGGSGAFSFSFVRAKPLKKENWLARAAPYRNAIAGVDWIVITAMPREYFLNGFYEGRAQSVTMLAWALVISLVIAGIFSAAVTAPIRRIALDTRALAAGEAVSEPGESLIAELNYFSGAFSRMAEQLEKYRDRIRLASKAMSFGIWDWDVATNELVWDDEMHRLYGISRNEFTGSYEDWAARVHPDDLPDAERRLREALEGKSDYSGEFRVIRPDGSTIVLRVSSLVFRDGSGRPKRMVGSNLDITRQKLNEEEILKLNSDLEKRVRERTLQFEIANRELAEARDAAEEAGRYKSEFLAKMSHEIRTPMNAVIGLTNLALRTDLNPKQRMYLEKTRIAAESLLGIINDILDFSRIEAGKLNIEIREFRLSEVMQQLRTVIGERAEAKGLKLDIIRDPAVPDHLIGAPVRLAQVLMNFCTNAVKFTDRGGVVLEARMNSASSGKRVLVDFSVTDTGIGMTRQQMEGLFEPFGKGLNEGGTGLGLAISKQLVDLMGGSPIEVSSNPGKGSCFRFRAVFTIPASDPADTPPDGSYVFTRILVLEKGTGVREAAAEMELPGIFFAFSGSPDPFISVRGDVEYDLIILDAEFAGGSWRELISTIREAGDQGVILLVPAEQPEFFQGTAPDNCLLLEKPVRSDALRDAIMALADPKTPERGSDTLSPGAMKNLEGVRVLLIEDNEINRIVAEDLITGSTGINLTAVESAGAALDILSSREFDIILTDVQMPVISGYELTSRIRANPAWSHLPVIALTAHALVSDREKCLAAGMNDFISKPFVPEQLFATLLRWIPGERREA